MSSARGRGNRDDDMTEHERQKWQQVARNQEKMDSLRLRQISATLQPAQPNKRTKVSLVQ
jgi:tellurite resistance protein